MEGRSLLILLGAVLLAAPVSLGAGFTMSIFMDGTTGSLIKFAAVAVTTVAAFIPAFMQAVTFLDQLVR